MELKEFMYELPRSLIAAYPAGDRAQSRLMVVRRRTGELLHTRFSFLGQFLSPGDLLVLNNSKVFPARLRGEKESGGRAEVLLFECSPNSPTSWIGLIAAAKKPRVGTRLFFKDGLTAEVVGEMGKGRFGIEFHYHGDFLDLLQRLGEPPLPPYIERSRQASSLDWVRYQTVYAARPGSIAAPTAGFHFTAELLEELEARGIESACLTLHVGPATFEPVREDLVEQHRMEGERYKLEPEAAEKIRRVKETGGKVVAVGSTTTRTLEWIAQRKGRVEADEGIARLFIYPGHPFRVIDGLITNFHLPGSTPLILVAAFMGLELLRRSYQEAMRLGYRFYSYGDAMLIL